MSLVESHEPWLGRIPSDWKRTRIRNIADLSPGYSQDPPAPSEMCTIVPMELLSEDGEIDVTSQQGFEDVQGGLTCFEPGDVLFAKITPCMENGKGAFVAKLPTRYGFGSTEFHVLRPSHAVDGPFLYYYTYNSVFRAWAAKNMTGAAGQKRVSSRFLKDTRVFLPSVPEQRLIAAFLDSSCAVIGRLASLKTGRNSQDPSQCEGGVLDHQMRALLAYRHSLIHECVTGQRRVTDADVRRARNGRVST